MLLEFFEMDGILNTDTYYTMEGIMTSLGRGGRPGLAGAAGKGYISYQLEGKHISVGKQYAGHKIALALQGLPRFRRASIITRKQANALAAVTARVLAVRGANRGDKGLCYGRILYWRCCPSYNRVNSRGFNGQ
jgi:hypothetical protein